MSWLYAIESDDVCLVEKVHGPTRAKLVAIRRPHPSGDIFVVGWTGFTGFRAIDDDRKLRWWRSTSEARMEAVIAMMMANGPRISKRRKPKHARDTQRSKVYRWEREFLRPRFEDEPEMTLDQCRELIKQVWIDRGRRFRLPKVHDGRRHRNAVCYDDTIALPKWARRRWTVLHEVAHALHPGDHLPAHGPIFMRTYIGLLHQYLGLNSEVLRREVTDLRIQVAK